MPLTSELHRVKMIEKLKQLIPVRGRVVLRRSVASTFDRIDVLLGRRDPLTPPDRLIFVGGDSSNFQELGEKWLQTFIHVGGLLPDERVLDVGCGIGRMAIALSRYLDQRGSYEGLDIVGDGINWCRKEITPRFPNFRFRLADIYNKQYNPAGRLEASEYRFPYQDNEFDFVFLTSVFTHMVPPDVENYLGEVQRVIRPGGRCLITFFLLNEESLRSLEKGEVMDERNFQFEIGAGCLTTNLDTPEVAIAFPEKVVKTMYEQCGLNIAEIYYGGWSGKPDAWSAQDVIFATK